jgi:hypothetical protein
MPLFVASVVGGIERSSRAVNQTGTALPLTDEATRANADLFH